MKTTYDQLTDNDIDQLHGLFMHIWASKEYCFPIDGSFYAELLDGLNIGWHIQNTAAILAETRQNMFYYFKDILKQKLEGYVCG